MKRTISLMQEYKYILSSLLGLKKKVKELEEGGGTTSKTSIPDWVEGTYPVDKIVAHNGGIWRSEVAGNISEPLECGGEGESSWEIVDTELEYIFTTNPISDTSLKAFNTTIITLENNNSPIGIDIPSGTKLGVYLEGDFPIVVLLTNSEGISSSDSLNTIMNNEQTGQIFMKSQEILDLFTNQCGGIITEEGIGIFDENNVYKLVSCPVTDFPIQQECDWKLLTTISSETPIIEQENIIRVPSATYSELGVTPESTIKEKQTAIAAFLEGYNNDGKDVLFFEIKEDLPINFDVTSTDWVGISKDDLITILENKGFTDIIINNFTNKDGRIECNLQTSTTSCYFSSLNITEVNILTVTGVNLLLLNNNQITNFNPIQPLPISVEYLNLSDNPITNFNPTHPLPITLIGLYINNTQITQCNLTSPVPTKLKTLHLKNNQIEDWSLSEVWINDLPIVSEHSVVNTEGNPTSSEGTNFKSILQSKGYNFES